MLSEDLSMYKANLIIMSMNIWIALLNSGPLIKKLCEISHFT